MNKTSPNRRTLDPGMVLVASCLGDGDTGGGLFSFDGQTVERIDRLSCTGLWYGDGRFARLLHTLATDDIIELLVYDKRGVVSYARIDDVTDPHDVLWDGSAYLVVATATNSILWIAPSGQIIRRWKAEGDGDAWHLNGLVVRDGILHVSAFGKFRHNREWNENRQLKSGIVFELESGRVVLSDLDCPHTPRFLDGTWVICNSGNHELLRIDPGTGQIIGQVALRGWTRGMAVTDDTLFIGESINRDDRYSGAMASIAMVDRRSFTLIGRHALSCREVYDLVMVPESMLQGMKSGFATSHTRMAEQQQFALFDQLGAAPICIWPTGRRLETSDRRIHIDAQMPSELQVGQVVEIECKVENLGSSYFVSLMPYPVHLSYKWLDPQTNHLLPGNEGLRTVMPQALPPRAAQTTKLRVQAPTIPGQYLLRLTAVQEHVAWFDDDAASNGCTGPVNIRPCSHSRA
jgi:acetolactate synthase I/II/III large subunit